MFILTELPEVKDLIIKCYSSGDCFKAIKITYNGKPLTQAGKDAIDCVIILPSQPLP